MIWVNGRAVPKAKDALFEGRPVAVDISSFVHEGENALTVRLDRGNAYVSVDYPTLVRANPAEVGLDPAAFEAIDALVASRAGVGPDKLYAGAVVLVTYKGRIVHESAIGYAQTHEGTQPLAQPRPMTTDTLFDMASVTKVEATVAAMLKLVDEGRLSLDDPLGKYLPEFGAEKGQITIRQMLTHRSGLWEWQPTYLHGRNKDEVLQFLADVPLRYPIGSGRHYSDIGGGMLPGVIIERVTGQSLDSYLRNEIYLPLGMKDTQYRPPASLRERIAATSFGNPYEYRMINTGVPYPVEDTGRADDFPDWRNYTLVGEANDGNAWYGWQGVAGHAGLFSTARDLAIYGQTLNNGGGYGNVKLASAKTVESFLVEPYDAGQAVGFWSRRYPGLNTLPASERGYGHNGFTGTEFVFDPARDVVVVLLTNRQHPGNPATLNGTYTGITSVRNGVLTHVLDAIRVTAAPRALAVATPEGTQATSSLTVRNDALDVAQPLNWTVTEAESDCASPSDLPWVSAAQTQGTIERGSSLSIPLTFSAEGLTGPATHNGVLCVSTSDVKASLIKIPVTFEVRNLRTELGAIRTQLAGHLSGDSKADKALRNALDALDDSIEQRNWLDGARLAPHHGRQVFHATSKAAKELESIPGAPSWATDAVKAIASIDETLARIAIDEASAPDAKEAAEKEKAKGDSLLAQGKYAQAIVHYRNAWERVASA